MTRMQRIRQKIINRAYYLSAHAEDEMLDDALERDDVEHVILKGRTHDRYLLAEHDVKERIQVEIVSL